MNYRNICLSCFQTLSGNSGLKNIVAPLPYQHSAYLCNVILLSVYNSTALNLLQCYCSFWMWWPELNTVLQTESNQDRVEWNNYFLWSGPYAPVAIILYPNIIFSLLTTALDYWLVKFVVYKGTHILFIKA